MSAGCSWPQHVVLHAHSGALALGWADLGEQVLSGQRLRSACRCAGCEQARRQGQAQPAAAGTRLEGISPVGEFGLQLHFSDGHKRGLFPWAYLRQLAMENPAP